MRVFGCPHCGAWVEFEDTVCLACRTEIAYDLDADDIVIAAGRALCRFRGTLRCSWVADADGAGACASCVLTTVRPATYTKRVLAELVVAEYAKRRLIRQLRHLILPIVRRRNGIGLTFELLASSQQGEKVVIGHVNGIITVDLDESNDAHREALKARLGEPYRTMLGHFRHEIGHYYWQSLVFGTDRIEGFRERFGDERVDYGMALDAHYGDGANADWQREHISQYATTHPWEDFAETFAHYLHIADALETTDSVGIAVDGPTGRIPDSLAETIHSRGAAVIARLEMPEVLRRWHGFSLALNAVNRSIGKDDLYPFVITPRIAEKLAWVHELVRGSA